jgi:hypothetical protein
MEDGDYRLKQGRKVWAIAATLPLFFILRG